MCKLRSQVRNDAVLSHGFVLDLIEFAFGDQR